MAEILQASSYFHGSLSPRTVGYGLHVSKVQKTASSSDFDAALQLFITNLQKSKDTKMSDQCENVDAEEVGPTMMDIDEDYDERLKAVIRRERANRIKEQNDLFQAKKLSLVLDLDHSLLHSIKFDEIDSLQQEILKEKEEKDRLKPQRHLFCFPHLRYRTKLRPGIWNFLEQASKIYELHICTMGGQVYADEMAKLLDPTGSLFGGRVMSKYGNGIKDLVGVLGMESTAVIMDDTLQVWPNHRMNLIHMDTYYYFPSSKCQGPSFFELHCDERPHRGSLAYAMKTVERVHQKFYSNPWSSLSKVDVRLILEEEKRSILAGCYILCTTVDRAEPDQDPMWQAARQFGAICTTEMDSRVTHVVSNNSEIDEVNWARITGRFVISPDWIRFSVTLYHRFDENNFAVV